VLTLLSERVCCVREGWSKRSADGEAGLCWVRSLLCWLLSVLPFPCVLGMFFTVSTWCCSALGAHVASFLPACSPRVTALPGQPSDNEERRGRRWPCAPCCRGALPALPEGPADVSPPGCRPRRLQSCCRLEACCRQHRGAPAPRDHERPAGQCVGTASPSNALGTERGR